MSYTQARQCWAEARELTVALPRPVHALSTLGLAALLLTASYESEVRRTYSQIPGSLTDSKPQPIETRDDPEPHQQAGDPRQSHARRIMRHVHHVARTLSTNFAADAYDSAIQGIDPGSVDRATEAARLQDWKAQHPDGIDPHRMRGIIAMTD
ncbi:MAG TPA: hypothetical protein VFN56_05280 [Candidatus Saccharimonadales bacterium]|nr:hypothetical protein [Candidatus Saccharimonadales bacterium]